MQDLPISELIDQVRFTLPTYISWRYGTSPLPATASSTSAVKTTLQITVQMIGAITDIDRTAMNNIVGVNKKAFKTMQS